jgi:hypothetical protein
MAPNAHEDLFLVMVKNGAVVDEVYAEGQSDFNDQGSTTVTTHCSQGDQVLVRQHGGDAVRAGYWTVFTGFLLHGDV